MEDAVLPQSLGPERGVLPGEGVSCGNETGCGAPVDEQVRVDAVGPGARAVVEPGPEPGPHRCGERDVAFADEQAAVNDVGQLKFADLFAAQRVEGDQCHSERDHGVRGVQAFSDDSGGQRQRDRGGDRPHRESFHRGW
jgi:hypothetical protein